MWILPLVGYIGIVVGFCFMTLAIASGLYYLSELVEEHTVFTRKFLTRLIYSVIAVHALLALVDQFSWSLSLVSIVSHAVYLGNLRHFPIVKLSDPVFILSCALVLTNHVLWFRHFSHPPASYSSSDHPYSRYDTIEQPTFTEIASYFGLCIWLVPFALFISLSAGENVLPSMGSEYATGGSPSVGFGAGGEFGAPTTTAATVTQKAKRSKGLIKAGADWVMDYGSETGDALGLWRSDRSRRF